MARPTHGLIPAGVFALLFACDGMVSERLTPDAVDPEGNVVTIDPTPGSDPGYPAPGETPDGPGGPVFKCNPAAPRESTGALVLTKAQLTNTLEDLFGSGAVTAASAVLGTLAEEVFDGVTHVRQSGLTGEKVESYYAIAKSVAAYVTADDGRTGQVFGACATGSDVTTACMDTFIAGFAEQILRRPLNGEETTFISGMMSEGSGASRDRLRAVLTYLLASPSFLWRVETGELDGDGVLRRTPHEVATHLAYTFTNSTPDSTLVEKAKTSGLGTTEEVRDEARRLLSTPRGRTKLIDAIARWSLNDRTADLSNLPPEILGASDPIDLSTAMIDEARVFIETMVFDRNATFEELLTSPLSFATDSELAALYGHQPATLDAPANFEGRRRGLLLRAAPLTSTGPRAHIINRGVDFQLRVLCNKIPEPTVDIGDARLMSEPTEEEKLEMSNREIVTQVTAAPVCQSCHKVINPTGFVFESFDSLGRIRDNEQVFTMEGELHGNVSLDASADVPLADGEAVTMEDAHAFVGWVGESDDGKACFARNMHRYLTEREEVAADECNMEGTRDVLLASSTPVVDLVVDALLHEDLFTKATN
ncbi:MAG: DUF1592 domain-containing protein [Myxococcota bacterium]